MTRLKGQSLVEVLLAIAVFVIGMATLCVLVLDASVTHRKSAERLKALALAQEGMEAVRSIRDGSFDMLAPGTHGLATSGTVWSFSSASDTYEGFTRVINVSASGTDYRVVTSTVSWQFTPTQTQSVSLAGVFTDWRRTPESWADPELVSSSTITGIPAYAVAVQGNFLYVTTAKNTNGQEFRIYDVTNPAAPVYKGGIETGTHVFTLDVLGSRAYLGSDNNPDEMKIIDVASSTDPRQIGTIKLTSNYNINAIMASGTTVEFVRDRPGGQHTFFIYDTANAASPQLLGSMDNGASAFDLAFVRGGRPWTFFATKDDTKDFQCVNTSDPSNMGIGGSVNIVNEDKHPASIVASGTLAFAGHERLPTLPELYVFNVTDPTHPSTLTSSEVGADVNRLAIWNNFLFLATGSSTKEFMVINVTDPVNPVLYGWYDLLGVATDIALSADGKYAYVTTTSTSAGLYILKTGN